MPRILRQFGLRTLLLFCALVAICAGIVRWHMQWVDGQYRIVAQIADRGGHIGFASWGPDWAHETFGNRYFRYPNTVSWQFNQLDDQDLTLLGSLTALEELELIDNQLSDDQSQVLDHLPNLRKLDLSSNRLTNAAMENVGRLKKLESLDIRENQIDEKGLTFLRDHRCLKTLRHRLTFTDVGIDELATIENLENDVIVGIELQEESLRLLRDKMVFGRLVLKEPACDNWGDYLIDHPTLKQLVVENATMTDRQLQLLLAADQLNGLSLSWVPVSKDGLATVSQATKLWSLELEHTGVYSHDVLEIFGPQTNVVDFNDNTITIGNYDAHPQVFWRGEISKNTLSALNVCRQTRTLWIHGALFDCGAFEFLANMPEIRRLTIADYPYPILFQWSDRLKHLHHIEITNSQDLRAESLCSLQSVPLDFLSLERTPITSAHMKCIGELTQLERLDISFSEITDDDFRQISPLENLVELKIRDCKRLTDEAFQLIGRFSKLNELEAEGVPVTDRGLKQLHGMPLLSELRVGSNDITAEALEELRQSLPTACVISNVIW